MKRIARLSLLILSLTLVICLLVSAGTTRRWVQGGREEFLKGDPESATITSEGGIILPPAVSKLFDSPQQFVWDLAVDNKGQLFVAGGNEGIIYDSRGNPVHNDAKPEIRSLAVGPDGLLYFATGPSGDVYRLDAAGRAEEFFTPKPEGGTEERYIWDMAFDSAGNLYVATGIEGRLYKVGRDGEGSVVFDSDEANLTSVAVDNRGRVYFGSDPNGQLFQLDAAGKVFVLFDSPLKEINNVALGPGGVIYATAVSEKAADKQEEEAKKESRPPSSSLPTVGKSGSISVSNATDSTAKNNGEISAIYRVLSDNTVEMIWSSTNQVAYSLTVDSDGRVLVGTGPKGLLISVDGNGIESALRRLEGMHVTALAAERGEIYAGVSNLGRVYRLSRQYANTGHFISQVKDTGTVSTFGVISWRAQTPAGTSLRLLTRSGNTKEPDNTWSAWSEAYTDSEGSTITSPAARFVQWKAELSTTDPAASPLLESVSVFYLQNNLRPRVKTAEVLPAGVTYKPSMPIDPSVADMPAEIVEELKQHKIQVLVISSAGQAIFQREMRTIRWKAEDANGDELGYRLLYRQIGSSEWSPLAKNLETTHHCFDSRSLADGTYVVRVEAHDNPSNPPDKSLSGFLDTLPFIVDNTPPQVEGLAATADARDAIVSFTATDNLSAIKEIRLRLDAGLWQAALPQDGLADSRSERVSVRLKGLEPGLHVITVQITDELYNVGSASISVTVR